MTGLRRSALCTQRPTDFLTTSSASCRLMLPLRAAAVSSFCSTGTTLVRSVLSRMKPCTMRSGSSVIFPVARSMITTTVMVPSLASARRSSSVSSVVPPTV